MQSWWLSCAAQRQTHHRWWRRHVKTWRRLSETHTHTGTHTQSPLCTQPDSLDGPVIEKQVFQLHAECWDCEVRGQMSSHLSYLFVFIYSLFYLLVALIDFIFLLRGCGRKVHFERTSRQAAWLQFFCCVRCRCLLLCSRLKDFYYDPKGVGGAELCIGVDGNPEILYFFLFLLLLSSFLSATAPPPL